MTLLRVFLFIVLISVGFVKPISSFIGAADGIVIGMVFLLFIIMADE